MERFGWFLNLNIDFESQISALFDTSPLRQYANFNDFIWQQLIFFKNLSNFVSFPWKLHNRYCHNLRSRLEKCLDPASQRCPACALTYDKKQSRLRHFIWSHQDLEGLVVQDAQVRLSEFMPSLRYFKTRQISAL